MGCIAAKKCCAGKLQDKIALCQGPIRWQISEENAYNDTFAYYFLVIVISTAGLAMLLPGRQCTTWSLFSYPFPEIASYNTSSTQISPLSLDTTDGEWALSYSPPI